MVLRVSPPFVICGRRVKGVDGLARRQFAVNHVFQVIGRRFSGDAVFFIGPGTKINQTAAVTAKRAIGRFRCPCHPIAAGGAADHGGRAHRVQQ